MKATDGQGDLLPIPNCTITVPGSDPIKMYILPDITDSKSAQYQDTPIIGRSFPIKTFSHSENRSITMKVHFIILKKPDAARILQELRTLQSAVYPRDGGTSSPYLPPPVCKIKCGKLLSKGGDQNGELCVVMKTYSVDFPPDVAWYSGEEAECLPYKFSMSLTWEVVYANENLPGQDNIMRDL